MGLSRGTGLGIGRGLSVGAHGLWDGASGLLDGTGGVPVYNNAALATWRTALSGRASAPANIAVIGDSIAEGWTTYTFGTRWVDLLATKLKTAYPTTGATGVGGSSFAKARYPDSFNGITAWTSLIGGGQFPNDGGFGVQGVGFGTVGGGARYTFTGTSFDLYFEKSAGTVGVASVSIDGGAATLVDMSANPTYQKWNSGALSAGTHTIDVTLSSGAYIFLRGFVYFNGDETKGIRTYNGGCAGASSATATTYMIAGATQALLDPDLAIVALSINDYTAQTALATFKTNIQGYISAERTGASNASLPILLVAYNQPGSVAVQPILYSQYITAMKQVADADPLVAVLDLSPYIPVCATSGTPDSLGFWDTDRLHPTAFGHNFIAGYVASALGL